MDKSQSIKILDQYWSEYQKIKAPKYRNINLDEWTEKYNTLMGLKSLLSNNKKYIQIIAALSQIIKRCKRLETGRSSDSIWNNIAERGLGKALPTVINKPRAKISFPFEWNDERSGQKCSLNKGYWGARNYMLMDALAYFFLLKEGGDRLPEMPSWMFDSIESIESREVEFQQDQSNKGKSSDIYPLTEADIKTTMNGPNCIRFNDHIFRKFTKLKLTSRDIKRLIQETSEVQFKLVFPVRLKEELNKAKEFPYLMNIFSSLFEFGYVDKEIRQPDGAILHREYWVNFNTFLGELFVHNLRAKNYDWIREDFYLLPETAQLLFRKLIINNDYPELRYYLHTIKQKLNLVDSNSTNLRNTVEQNALEPLRVQGFIDSYQRTEGLYGDIYLIKRVFDKNK